MRRMLFLSLIVLTLVCRPVGATGPQKEEQASFVEIYSNLLKDPVYQELRARIERRPASSEELDRLLDYLPISPLEMLKADMHLNRYEFMVPAISLELHRRWIARHPDLARRFYGESAVEETASDVAINAKATAGAVVGMNRNLASGTGTPATTSSSPGLQIQAPAGIRSTSRPRRPAAPTLVARSLWRGAAPSMSSSTL